jgi:hypothetical protein
MIASSTIVSFGFQSFLPPLSALLLQKIVLQSEIGLQSQPRSHRQSYPSRIESNFDNMPQQKKERSPRNATTHHRARQDGKAELDILEEYVVWIARLLRTT